VLRRLEEALRAALEAPFAHLFPEQVQPLEMAAALREAMTASRRHTPEGSFAHNEYTLRLSLADHRSLASIITSLERELASHLREFAATEGLQVGAAVTVLVAPDDGLGQGQMRCGSAFAVRPAARLEGVSGPGAKGHSWPLAERTAIGRSAECDIRLEDLVVSRHHAEVAWCLVHYELRDLGSQNGSHVNGQPTTRSALADRDLVELGLTQLRFRLV